MSDSGNTIAPGGPWDAGRDIFSIKTILNGRSNLSSLKRAVKTESQRLSGSVNMTGYKLETDAKLHDFYCVFGSFEHGIDGYGENIVSVGYYATAMSLTLELENGGQEAELWDHGPTSTVGETTTSFSIGANLSGGMMGGEPILQGGVSGSFGTSFSAPDVRISAAAVGTDATWTVSLPKVGFVSAGVPKDPKAPSSGGYKWYFGAIYVVSTGNPFTLRVRPKVIWEYDYTRGIKNDVKTWAPDDSSNLYTYTGNSA